MDVQTRHQRRWEHEILHSIAMVRLNFPFSHAYKGLSNWLIIYRGQEQKGQSFISGLVSALCRAGQSKNSHYRPLICQWACRWSSVSTSRTLTWESTCGFFAKDLYSHQLAPLIPQTPCAEDSVNRKAMRSCCAHPLTSCAWVNTSNCSSLPPWNNHLLCDDPDVGCRV